VNHITINDVTRYNENDLDGYIDTNLIHIYIWTSSCRNENMSTAHLVEKCVGRSSLNLCLSVRGGLIVSWASITPQDRHNPFDLASGSRILEC
jgi:hypothetical protein